VPEPPKESEDEYSHNFSDGEEEQLDLEEKEHDPQPFE
jgi:hypothetical protein